MINAPLFIYRKAENELWISEMHLLHLLPTLSETYLRVRARPIYKSQVSKCHRDKTFLPRVNASWRFAKINGTFYYEYDSIPDKAPNRYAAQLPQRTALIHLAKTATPEKNTAIEPFLNDHLNDYKQFSSHYGDCTKQQQENLSRAAAFIKGCIEYYIQNELSEKDNSFFEQASIIAKAAEIKYIPLHVRNLKALILKDIIATNQQITEAIQLYRRGNTNAVIHMDDAELRSWIIQMRFSSKNFTNSYIIRKLQYMCMVCEKRTPSERWIGGIMEEANTKFLTAAGRYGAKGRHGQLYRGYTPFANALYAGDCWQVDGSRFNIIDFKLSVEQDGKIIKKQVFLYVVAVRDVHSGDILGYSFNISENRWTVHNALKMAVEEAGYLPYEIVFDRFPGHNTPEMIEFIADLENRGVKVTFTNTAQGKPKIERWFRTLQEVFMQESDYYYGEGIQSRNEYAHRSKEYLKEMRSKAKKAGWDFDAACNEAATIIENYRSTALSKYSRKFKTIEDSPALIHDKSEKPNVIHVEQNQITYLFGLRRKAKIANMGLVHFEMQGVTFSYRCAEYKVNRKYDQVTICYDLEDMSNIHLYEISDKPLKKYLGMAEEVPADMTPYGPDAFKGYGKQQAIIKQLTTLRDEEVQYAMAVGYDSMSILDSGNVSKQVYEEADRQATFTETFGNSGIMDDDDSFEINIDRAYS
ncbi:MAG: transposase [Sphingobacteriia bacterium]|nr:MAG: transposase [Sphingobacteriia bacterium]